MNFPISKINNISDLIRMAYCCLSIEKIREPEEDNGNIVVNITTLYNIKCICGNIIPIKHISTKDYYHGDEDEACQLELSNNEPIIYQTLNQLIISNFSRFCLFGKIKDIYAANSYLYRSDVNIYSSDGAVFPMTREYAEIYQEIQNVNSIHKK
jgi:hypothetical protein